MYLLLVYSIRGIFFRNFVSADNNLEIRLSNIYNSSTEFRDGY
jgi:hypothetical protein